MDLGIFMEEARPDVSAADAFREKLDLAQAADAWGVHGVWLGEIHFSPERSVCSAPTVVGAAIATTTRRIRVGAAHGTQLAGHFLIDRQGIVRWAEVEAAARTADIGKWPAEEEILSAARALRG